MIAFNYETNFKLENPQEIENWVITIISDEMFELGEINYIFCNDEYLHKLNVEFLQHDTLTDIISFDYTHGKVISGDIYISVERVEENAQEYNVTFAQEIRRVMAHGVLHYLGYKDTTKEQKNIMRSKENECLKMLNT